MGAALACGVALTACGTASPTPAAHRDPVRVMTDVASLPLPMPPRVHPIPAEIPHFRSPEAAMVYLAEAWNQRDGVALQHVTDPSARWELEAMHSEATNLRLRTCEPTGEGDYGCYFTHDYPAEHLTDQERVRGVRGQAWFRVGPAKRSGWYMTVLEECG